MISSENHDISPIGTPLKGLKRTISAYTRLTSRLIQARTQPQLTVHLTALTPHKISLISCVNMSASDTKDGTRVAPQRPIDTGAA
jgi:hypothetical protein